MAANSSHRPCNTSTQLADLHEDATCRARAARDLAQLLTRATFHDLDNRDFLRTCEVFDFLLGDVCVSLAAMERGPAGGVGHRM
jgi:hypothetical protein